MTSDDADREGERVVSGYPNFPGKHRLNAYVNPRDTIDYVRAHGDLDGYRELKGISQRALGVRLGHGQSVISKAESVPNKPLAPDLRDAFTRAMAAARGRAPTPP